MERFDLYPAKLLGDSAYGSAEMLGWLVYEHGIEPHVTVFDKSPQGRHLVCTENLSTGVVVMKSAEDGA